MQIIFSTPRLVRNGQLIEGLWRLVAAIGLASLTFAGALFLSFHQTPRLFFIYFVLLQLALALGTGGYVLPWIAAWSPNAFFAFVGLALTWRVR